ncbi:DUF1232 domain-containing protein [Clostridium bovifaecis]|uniref:DUF1232 domain-containing protein n=1 Tax=Clostridium bovifaecis TaxID=2184719 RepID=A0A6I6EQ86_9CLOT|nr:DUF1232 domain-containing protein [Clostridium bovifaecis]
MRIANIRVKLTEKDLLSIIDENLKVQGLKIEGINIGELIKVQGFYVKGIKLKFKASLGLGSIENNVLKLKVFNAKLGIIPVWTRLINFALKKVLKNFSNMGIKFEKNTMFIDFTTLCKYVPSVDFILKGVTTNVCELEVEVENLTYKKDKQAVSLDELKEKVQSSEEIEYEQKKAIKTVDGYTKFRSKVQGQFSNNIENSRGRFSKGLTNKTGFIAEYIMLMPDIIALLYRLMKDRRIKLKTKTLIGAALAYLVLPADIVPEAIPVLGKVDDFGIGFLILDKIIEDVPQEIILQHWQGKDDIIIKAKEIKEALFSTIGRKNTIGFLSSGLIAIKNRKNRKNTN